MILKKKYDQVNNDVKELAKIINNDHLNKYDKNYISNVLEDVHIIFHDFIMHFKDK